MAPPKFSPFGILLLAAFSAGCGDDAPTNPPVSNDPCPPAQHEDGMGGCTSDPCIPSPCIMPNRNVCTSDGASASCACNPGYHDEAGSCLADTTCMATTCNGHGTCSDGSGTIACSCDAGYAGSHCQDCDTKGGYIPDGNGGCTNTPCMPNPCSSDKPQCTVQDGIIVCECGAGTHEENGFCVPDSTCMATTCGGHGTCMETHLFAECATIAADITPMAKAAARKIRVCPILAKT
jgi:hypothetical protein